MHRLANQPTFAGKVQAGRDYVLLDDTLAQGGTLAQLKTHIERGGGRVVLATALTAKDYSRKLALDPDMLRKVRGRYGSIEGWWKQQFGYGFDGLTESEARAILTYDKDVFPLTDSEIASLQEKSKASSAWARQQLAIDPELKHLGHPGG